MPPRSLRRTSLTLSLLTLSCSHPYPTATSDTFSEVEMALVDFTAKASAQQGVKVRGEITEKMYPALAQSNPTAWYQSGVAYYYRPNVKRYVSLSPEPGKETAWAVATHEVCHATHYAHDCAHWVCMVKFATPTYPEPGDCR